MTLPNEESLDLALGSSFTISRLKRKNSITKEPEEVLWITTPFYDTKNDVIYLTVRETQNSKGEKLLYISDERYASDFLWSVMTFRPKAKKAVKMIKKIIKNNNAIFQNGFLFIRLLPEEGKNDVLVAEQIKNLTRIILIVTALPLTMK